MVKVQSNPASLGNLLRAAERASKPAPEAIVVTDRARGTDPSLLTPRFLAERFRASWRGLWRDGATKQDAIDNLRRDFPETRKVRVASR